tara:strand:+ start:2164 stop:2979 length:816 start_codon:yes stop_codon:yes gene_type:complete
MKEDLAIIIIGQIRLKSKAQIDRWEQIKKDFQRYDIYIGTYKSYGATARELTPNIFLLDDQKINAAEYLKLPDTIIANDVNKNTGFSPVWQHILLRGVLEKYDKELGDYKNIVKARSDSEFNIEEVIKTLTEHPEKICACTDFLFGSNSKLFKKMFLENNFLSYIKKVWNKDENYISINYKNLLKSFEDGFMMQWGWLCFKNLNEDITKENVIDLCQQNIENGADVNNFKTEDTNTKTKKSFNTAFSSEKQLLIYFLFFSSITRAHVRLVR